MQLQIPADFRGDSRCILKLFDAWPCKKRPVEQLNEKRRRRSEAKVSMTCNALLVFGASLYSVLNKKEFNESEFIIDF